MRKMTRASENSSGDAAISGWHSPQSAAHLGGRVVGEVPNAPHQIQVLYLAAVIQRRCDTVAGALTKNNVQHMIFSCNWGIYRTFSPFSCNRLYTNSRNSVYSTLVSGINSSIPATPIRLPPTDTAASTQMEGRPTELPTTWG